MPLKTAVFEPLEVSQLLPIVITLPEDQDPRRRDLVAADRSWGMLNSEGYSSWSHAIGDEQEGVRESRRLLASALCSGYDNFSPFSTGDLQLHQALDHTIGLEEVLQEVGAGTDLSVAVQGVRKQLKGLQRQYRLDRTADLDRFIRDDPSEIMVGVVANADKHSIASDKLRGLVLLDSVIFKGLDYGELSRPPITKAVVSGEDGKLGTLPKGHAVDGLFVEVKD